MNDGTILGLTQRIAADVARRTVLEMENRKKEDKNKRDKIAEAIDYLKDYSYSLEYQHNLGMVIDRLEDLQDMYKF